MSPAYIRDKNNFCKRRCIGHEATKMSVSIVLKCSGRL